MNTSNKLDELLRAMPAIPAVCARILGKIQDPNIDFQTMSELIQYDPGITANLLRLVNSAYFGLEEPVSSLKEACRFAGTKKIMQLALAQSVAGVLNRPLAGYGLAPREFLQHAAWVAVASEEFCIALRLRVPDTIFTAGLLHDVGKIVLNDLASAEKQAIERMIEEQGFSHVQAERVVMDTDHAEAGARLIALWNLPQPLVEAARWHHEPERATLHGDIVNIVHLANVLSTTLGIGAGNAEIACHPLQRMLDTMKLTPTIVESVASRTLEKMQALENMLAGASGGMMAGG